MHSITNNPPDGLSIEDICKQRLDAIKNLEAKFTKSPSIDTAIILRDLWTNWVEEEWEKYLPEKSQTILEGETKRKYYSLYIMTSRK